MCVVRRRRVRRPVNTVRVKVVVGVVKRRPWRPRRLLPLMTTLPPTVVVDTVTVTVPTRRTSQRKRMPTGTGTGTGTGGASDPSGAHLLVLAGTAEGTIYLWSGESSDPHASAGSGHAVGQQQGAAAVTRRCSAVLCWPCKTTPVRGSSVLVLSRRPVAAAATSCLQGRPTG